MLEIKYQYIAVLMIIFSFKMFVIIVLCTFIKNIPTHLMNLISFNFSDLLLKILFCVFKVPECI